MLWLQGQSSKVDYELIGPTERQDWHVERPTFEEHIGGVKTCRRVHVRLMSQEVV